MRERPRPGRRVLVGALALAAAGAVRPAAAQEDVKSLAARCGGSNVAMVASCREGALALQALQGGVGLLSAGGAQVVGSASTLGKRFGGTPRFAPSLRAALVRANLPDVREAGAPLESESFIGLGLHGSLALGLFDGFSILPTVGGVLSLDVFGSAGVLFLPGGDGFREDPAYWGLGARVGIFRESFTMPGVTVSVARRSVGEAGLGDLSDGHAMEVLADGTVLSVRGTVGKDLLALGVLAGAGWDRYASEGSLAIRTGTGSASTTTFEEFESDRVLFFGGVSVNFLLLQLSLEGGWAQGFDAPEGRGGGGYDPSSGALFLSAAARLTL